MKGRPQREITESKPLLDAKGNLTEVGYSKKLIQKYDKRAIKTSRLRLKEWDYYYVGNEHYGVALTIADNGYMGLDSISFLMFDKALRGLDVPGKLAMPWEITKSSMKALTLGCACLPETSEEGISESMGRGYRICFEATKEKKHLMAYMENFKYGQTLELDIELNHIPEESMVICTPFEKDAHFYFNQKVNCMRASGFVKIGFDIYQFNEDDSFGLLDWGRGVWTYHNTWYWGSASGLVDGHDFGWNIGYGFGDTSAASENMLFYDGKAHKISEVKFNIPGEEWGECRFTEEPWTFTSDDDRFRMVFEPVLDRASCTDIKLIKSDQHQVFGKFTGWAVLDDGTKINVKDFFGFAEKVENKW